MTESGPVIVAIPAYNEARTIAEIVLKASHYVDKVVVCDDGSTDLTAEIAAKLGAVVVNHSQNKGKGAALRSLFFYAKEIGARAMVTIDGDAQHMPEEIPLLIEELEASGSDIVVGSRFVAGGDINGNVPKVRRIGNALLTRMTSAGVTDSQSGFRAYGGRAISTIVPTEMSLSVDSEILIKAREKGLKIVEVPISIDYNVPNPSKRNFIDQATTAMFDIVKLYSIKRPLFFYGLTGTVFFFLGLGLLIYSLLRFEVTKTVFVGSLIAGFAFTIAGTILVSVGLMLWVLIAVVRERP